MTTSTRTTATRTHGTAAVIMVLVAACSSPSTTDAPASSPGPALVPSAPQISVPDPQTPTVTSPPTDLTTKVPPAPEPIPAELVGRWQSTGEGNSELIYEFASDGGYKHAGVLVQELPSGVFSFIVEAAGTSKADGDTLTLRPKRGKRTLNDPNSASGPKEQPIDRSPQQFTWELDGNRLVMTDSKGITVTYRRL